MEVEAHGQIDPKQHGIAILPGIDVSQALSGADIDAPSDDHTSQHEHNGVGDMLQLLPAHEMVIVMPSINN